MTPDFYLTYNLSKTIFELMKEVEGLPTRMITVWIPLDHEVTDQDTNNIKKLGTLLEPVLKPFRSGHSATSYSLDKIGLVIAGLIVNEDARQEMIPLLKEHCPQETYFTIEEIFDDKDEIDTFDIPLFEPGELAIVKKF